jgi:DNA-binding IclR family transcriptional regulator
MSSIAVPVFGVGHTLYGALCISGTAKRLGRAELAIHFATLQESSQNLSKALAKIAWSQPLRASNAWHPIP